jgi:hypothetical protein
MLLFPVRIVYSRAERFESRASMLVLKSAMPLSVSFLALTPYLYGLGTPQFC